MRAVDWLQLGLYVGALALITKPMGLYLVRVLDANGRTWLDPIFKPLEQLTYWLMGVKSEEEQDWKKYTFAMLLFSVVSCLFTYAILRLQHILPLDPQGFGALSPDLAFNTATSFTTNTNWQSYTGESTMSTAMLGNIVPPARSRFPVTMFSSWISHCVNVPNSCVDTPMRP